MKHGREIQQGNGSYEEKLEISEMKTSINQTETKTDSIISN
jgi:hypothetical protein